MNTLFQSTATVTSVGGFLWLVMVLRREHRWVSKGGPEPRYWWTR